MKKSTSKPNLTKGAGKLSDVLAKATTSAKPPSTGGKSPQNRAKKR